MATQGPLTPTAASGASWTNPTNIEGNSAFAGWTVAAGDSITTSLLIGTSFGFSIPAGATINGVSVSFSRKKGSTNFVASTNQIELRNSGALLGTAKIGPGTSYTTSSVAETYGSSSDVWGATLTDSIINGSTFGFAITVNGDNSLGGVAGTISINNYSITVTYTAGGVTLCQTSTFGF